MQVRGTQRDTNLSAGRLGEPECPPVGKGMLDIEVVLVVENGDGLVVVLGGGALGLVTSIGGDGDGGKIDLVGHGEVCVCVWSGDLSNAKHCRVGKWGGEVWSWVEGSTGQQRLRPAVRSFLALGFLSGRDSQRCDSGSPVGLGGGKKAQLTAGGRCR